MNGNDVPKGIVVNKLNSWREFLKWIDEKHAYYRDCIYRGQANAEWLVESTLDRLEKKCPNVETICQGRLMKGDCPPIEREKHLEAFKEVVRNKRGINPPQLDESQWWAFAQHHGLATPVLDWTRSAFIALFFAFEAEKVVAADGQLCEPKDRAVFSLSYLRIKEYHTKEDPAPRAYTTKTATSHRVDNQAAVFLHMPPQTDLETYVREHFADETSGTKKHEPYSFVLEKFIIPNEGRIECLKLLNKMNINRNSLFPDIDGAAQYINALWELNFDTLLGELPDRLEL